MKIVLVVGDVFIVLKDAIILPSFLEYNVESNNRKKKKREKNRAACAELYETTESCFHPFPYSKPKLIRIIFP